MKCLPCIEHFQWPIQIKYALFVTLINHHKSVPEVPSLNKREDFHKGGEWMHLDLIAPLPKWKKIVRKNPACSFHPKAISGFDITGSAINTRAISEEAQSVPACPDLSSLGSPFSLLMLTPQSTPQTPGGPVAIPSLLASHLWDGEQGSVSPLCPPHHQPHWRLTLWLMS